MKALIAILVFAASGTAALPAAAQPGASDPGNLVALETELSASYVRHDPSVIQRVVAADWVGYYNGEKLDKTGYARIVTDGTIVFHSIRNHDVTATYYGDVAVVQGFDDEVTTEKGTRASHTYQWTDIFQKRDGRWLLVRSQNNQVK